MENVYKGLKTILLFLIVTLAVQTMFGDKVAQRLSILTLVMMLLYQSETFANYINSIIETLSLDTSTEDAKEE